jgi:release factor glutamine methyltransferase
VTLAQALLEAAVNLEEARVPSPRLTAEVLLGHCLGVERPYLYSHDRSQMDARQEAAYREMILRRTRGEPLQYITGTQEFRGRAFCVNPAVLIPRPETEFIVDSAVELNTWTSPRIADIGTGSGCIAVTLALELPGSRVLATDVSFPAIRVAFDNARRLGASVSFAAMDRMTALGRGFEFVVSNPPYVAADQYPGLQREVREHEPRLALVGEPSPLALIDQLIADAIDRLVPGGFLLLEVGYSMDAAVRSLFDEHWRVLPTRQDLAGIPRIVVAQRKD